MGENRSLYIEKDSNSQQKLNPHEILGGKWYCI